MYRLARNYPQLGLGACSMESNKACCDSCAHGGSCGRGLGLFESGWDLAGWGWQEMAIAGLGLFMVYSTFSTTSRGYQSVRGGVRKRSSRARKKRDLEWRRKKLDKEYAEL